MGDRGQAFTLEAFLASLLLVTSLVFAIHATAVTPLSSSTSNRHVEDQLTPLAAGILDASVANGSLKPTVLYWNDTRGTFHGTSVGGYYVTGGPPTPFGGLLDRTFYDDGVVFDVNVEYLTQDGKSRTVPLVKQGSPSDHAARAYRTLTLFDDDVLYRADGTPTNVTLSASSTFFAPDVDPGDVYNVVRVEVVVWRA